MHEAARLILPPEEVTPRFSQIDGNENNMVTCLGCVTTPDGRALLATASFGTFVAHLWDLESGRHLHTLTGHNDAMLDVAWGRAAGGRWLLATASLDRTVRIWDPATGQQLHTLTGHNEFVQAVAWGTGPDGRPLLATASLDRTVRIWDPATGQQLRILSVADTFMGSVAWGTGPDGQPLLATGGYDGTARIWDPATGQQLHTFSAGGTEEIVLTVDWGTEPDGRPLLVVGSFDGTVRTWGTVSGQQLRTFTAGVVADDEEEQVHVVSWARTTAGRSLLAAAGVAKIARIWDPATGAQLAALPGTGAEGRSAAWLRDRAGNLLLLLANPDDAAVPVRAWLVESGGVDQPETVGIPT